MQTRKKKQWKRNKTKEENKSGALGKKQMESPNKTNAEKAQEELASIKEEGAELDKLKRD